MEKYYKISETRLEELLKAELELDQLNAGGVDNWTWYGEGKEEECDETLKKCPFCGGEAENKAVGNYIFWIKCKKCGAEGDVENSKENAVLKWNKRV